MKQSSKVLVVVALVSIAAYVLRSFEFSHGSNRPEAIDITYTATANSNRSVVPTGVAGHKWMVQTVEYVRDAEGEPADSLIIETKEQE